ncbi:uncharacterized protein LOC119617645 isoform X1 [Kryptolebias marmoratus]|uniref:uncharacterized protein LOC119617645 isoform X1 n=1 Tax=Kryptolebias marmoratus TaxID=37003 RepID=UPI0018ACCEFF|nr:uncharacterized protein LOC119617645 isoform X1 [Kryptolebias marmoratus]
MSSVLSMSLPDHDPCLSLDPRLLPAPFWTPYRTLLPGTRPCYVSLDFASWIYPFWIWLLLSDLLVSTPCLDLDFPSRLSPFWTSPFGSEQPLMEDLPVPVPFPSGHVSVQSRDFVPAIGPLTINILKLCRCVPDLNPAKSCHVRIYQLYLMVMLPLFAVFWDLELTFANCPVDLPDPGFLETSSSWITPASPPHCDAPSDL